MGRGALPIQDFSGYSSDVGSDDVGSDDIERIFDDNAVDPNEGRKAQSKSF